MTISFNAQSPLDGTAKITLTKEEELYIHKQAAKLNLSFCEYFSTRIPNLAATVVEKVIEDLLGHDRS